MIHTRWSNTMAGEEYARIYSWGNDPKRKVRSLLLNACITSSCKSDIAP